MKLILDIGNNWVNYSFDDEVPVRAKSQFLSAVAGMCTVEYGSFHKGWDGQNKMTKKELALYTPHRFPTGLLEDVFSAIYFTDDIEVEFNINRVKPKNEPYEYTFLYEFDEKQKLAIKIALEEERGYIHAATGAGKTAIIARLIAELGGNSLIIEPSIDLVAQTADELRSIVHGVHVIEIQGKKSLNKSGQLVVASVDTLNSNLDELVRYGWLNQFDNLFLDEVHHANLVKEKAIKEGRKVIERRPATTTAYYNIAMQCNAYFRFGLTATPDKSELFIKAITGNKLIEIDEPYLISIGRLARPYYIIYKHDVEFHEEYKDSMKHEIYENEHRNYILLRAIQEIEALGGTSLLMIDSKKFQLAQLQDYLWFPALTGSIDKDVRKEYYNQLRNGELQSLLLTVGKEGLNIPSVDCIVRGGARKSETQVTQETGRGKRAKKGKENRVIVIDTFDNDGSKARRIKGKGWRTKIGHLRKHSEQRLEIYEKHSSSVVMIVESEEELVQKIREVF